MPTEAEWAWAGGLFEGEGCFHITRSKWGTLVPTLGLGMTDRDTVERWARIVGAPGVRGPQVRPERKPMFQANVATRSQVVIVTSAFLPWLGERRTARAQEVLALAADLDAAAARRLVECKRGHPWTPENVYVSPRGIRACRECKRAHGLVWMREYRAGLKHST